MWKNLLENFVNTCSLCDKVVLTFIFSGIIIFSSEKYVSRLVFNDVFSLAACRWFTIGIVEIEAACGIFAVEPSLLLSPSDSNTNVFAILKSGKGVIRSKICIRFSCPEALSTCSRI